jgi:hypothetical protein
LLSIRLSGAHQQVHLAPLHLLLEEPESRPLVDVEP